MRKMVLVAALIASPGSWAQSCYETSVVSPSPFLGNDGEIVKLSDGTLWEVKYEYEYLYEYYPTVIVCPGKGKIGIKGKMLNVEPLGTASSSHSSRGPSDSTIIDSQIDGDFNGWEGETIVKLINGQVWQQVDGRYKFKYKYSPKVMLIKRGSRFEMHVDGVEGTVSVVQLR